MSNAYYPDRTGPYRSRRGMIFGVCRGLADYLDFSAFWIRVLFVIAFILSGFWPVGAAYIVAALVMKLEPRGSYEPGPGRGPESTYRQADSRRYALERLKKSFGELDRRIQRMEDIVTDKEYDWERRFNS